jgi:phage baseplate assembly protein W
MAKKIIHSDLDLNFLIHPVRKDISKKVNEDAIKTSLKNLVRTKYYDRLFDPNKGCGIHNLLFENMIPATTIAIEKSIEDVIYNYEPRVELLEVQVIPTPSQNLYDITIFFAIVNQPDEFELNLQLERIR